MLGDFSGSSSFLTGSFSVDGVGADTESSPTPPTKHHDRTRKGQRLLFANAS